MTITEQADPSVLQFSSQSHYGKDSPVLKFYWRNIQFGVTDSMYE